jgi:hypothetical protein
MSKRRKKKSGAFTYLILVLMVFSAAVNTGLNLLFFVSIFMVIVVISASIIGKINVSKIKIKRVIKREIYEGENVKFEYNISAKHDICYLEIKENLPTFIISDAIPYINYLKRNKEISLQSEFTFTIPGIFYMEGINAKSSFPIAILAFEKKYEKVKNEITVFPRYFDLTYFPDEILESYSENEQFAVRIGSGENIWGIKPYEFGDRIRDICWKISAKSDDLMVKIREQPQGKKIWILPILKDLIKDQWNADVLRVAASIVKNRLNYNSIIGTIVGSRINFPTGGKGQLFSLLKELTYIWNEENLLSDTYKNSYVVERNDIVFIVTNKSPTKFSALIEGFKKNNVLLIIVYIENNEGEGRKLLFDGIKKGYYIYIANRKRLNETFQYIHN